MRRVALVVSLLLICAAAPRAHASQVTEITIPARNGEIANKWLPGYPGPPRARVFLPDNYDPAKQYPLLVLLAGLNSNYRVWSDPGEGQIAKTAAGFDGIIVMPESGSGWYADWWNGGKRGGPSWESYELDEVIPQILERYRIRPERRWHALAGVSMGGLGTAYLGGRMPGFFGSIAIISGLVDGHLAPGEGVVQSVIPEATAGGPLDPEAVMGPAGGFYSYGHDPVRLASNLAQTRVFMAAGNGVPTSDGEPDRNNLLTDLPSEAAVIRPASDVYAPALSAAGVDFTYQTHNGIHDWANFRRELRDAIAWGLFQPVDENPTSWLNDTVAAHGRLWGLSYRFDAPPDRVVRFRRAGGQLSISAAGSPLTLTTDGGCVLHVATPGTVDLPGRACTKLGVTVRPRRLHPGRWTPVRVTVTPAAAGTFVRSGRQLDEADATGVAYLRLCASSARGVRLTARAPGFAPMRVAVRAHGRARACRAPAS